MFRRTTLSVLLTVFWLSITAVAYAQDFTDLPSHHPAFTAIQDLKARGILSGYADGTFKPDAQITRGEAVKMLMAPLLAGKDLSAHSSSPYSDVPKGVWYLPYIEEARLASVIDGPPLKTAFLGERTVLKAEFIKMLLKAHAVDLGFVRDMNDPFAIDVQPGDWHSSFMQYGVASSMLFPDIHGKLYPAQELTRADGAMLLFAFLQYREGKRAQVLLSAADKEMAAILQSFEAKNSQAALFAATTAFLQATGAEQSRPEALTRGVVYLSQAFLALAKGNVEGSVGKYSNASALASEAWKMAARAMQETPTLAVIGQKVQEIAHTMAESARAH